MSVATFVIHIDNMSYRVSENDVVEFLAINPENILNIKMVKNDRGQANGDCYVEISNQSDAEAALKKHLTQFAGRKAQISKSSPEEMNNSRAPVKVKGGKGGKWDGTVRLYGFSYESTIDTVMEFCQGLDVLPGRVVIEKDVSGRSSGNAYVQFATFTGAYGALDRNKKQLDSIGRYIDSEASSNVDYRICVLI